MIAGMVNLLHGKNVQAGMISTLQAVEQESESADRAKVADFLSKDDVRAQMLKMGVDPKEARDLAQAGR